MFASKEKALLKLLIVGGAFLFLAAWLFAIRAFPC